MLFRAKTMLRKPISKRNTKNPLRGALLAAILTMSIFVTGCAPIVNKLCVGDPDADVVLDATIFQNVSFQIAISGQYGMLRSRKFWFADRDYKVVRYGWDDILFHERDPDEHASCDYLNTSEDCKVCSICNGQCTNGDEIHILPTGHSFGDLTELDPDGTVRILSQALRPTEFCFRSPNGPNQFQPQFTAEKDGASYGFTSKSSCGQTSTQWQLQTSIVKSPRILRQSLEVYRDATDAAPRYRFRMPEENGFLRENFSHNLKIYKIRVLLGVRNPQTGVELVLDDPESLRRVRPSRILFLPDFLEGNVNRSPTESSNRCYVDPAKDDGGFDLANSCKRSPGGAHFAQNITPTFQNGRFSETLDWIIEYKTTDGIPSLPDFQTTSTTEEFPVIEWTIDQN